MAAKIYLAPSNQGANRYVIGNINERDVCNSITDKLFALLQEYDVAVRRGENSQTIQQKAAEANAWGASVYLSIHTNAGGGEGTEVWYNPKRTGSMAFAKCIYDAVAPKSPGRDRGLKSSILYLDLNQPKMPCCLCELAFHDNRTDTEWLLNRQEEIAAALVRGLIAYTGMKKKTVDKKEETVNAPVASAMELTLSKVPLYATAATARQSGTVTGSYYLWSDAKVRGRYRITNKKERVGVAGQVTGWIEAKYVEDVAVGDNSEKADDVYAGKQLQLAGENLYATAAIKKAAGRVTGTYYLWNDKKVNGRYRITNRKERVGAAGQVTGWIDETAVI